MNRVSKVAVTGLVAAAMWGTVAGVASAAEQGQPAAAPQAAAGTPIYGLPGVDLGALLGPTVQLPTELLGVVNNLMNQG